MGVERWISSSGQRVGPLLNFFPLVRLACPWLGSASPANWPFFGMLAAGIYVALALPSCVLFIALCVVSYHLVRLRAQLRRQHRLSTATFVWVPPKEQPTERDSGRWSASERAGEQTSPVPAGGAGGGLSAAAAEPSELERESFEVIRASYVHMRRASMETLVIAASPPPLPSGSGHSARIEPWLLPVREDVEAGDPIPTRPSGPLQWPVSQSPASPPTTPPQLRRRPSLNGTPSLNTIYELPALTLPDRALPSASSFYASFTIPSPPPTPNSFASTQSSTTAPPTPPHTPPGSTRSLSPPPIPTRSSSHTFGPHTFRPGTSTPSPLTLPPPALTRATSLPVLGHQSPTRSHSRPSDSEKFYSLPLTQTTPTGSGWGVGNARLEQRRRQARRVGSGVSLADLFREDEEAAQDAVGGANDRV